MTVGKPTVAGAKVTAEVLKRLHEVVPQGGANLERAFTAVRFLPRLPDSIVLLTDGIPTSDTSADPETAKVGFFGMSPTSHEVTTKEAAITSAGWIGLRKRRPITPSKRPSRKPSTRRTPSCSRAPRTGELWRNPNLAATLETIGRDGRDAFYKGDIARKIDAYFAANDGFLAYDDLAAHTGEWVEPVSANYRGVDVWEIPPNGQGIAALICLGILRHTDVASHALDSADWQHVVIRAA